MAYDFPSSPTNGQQYTPAGGQTYTWDAAGTKWTVTGTGLTSTTLGHRNLLINGDFAVDQRKNGAVVNVPAGEAIYGPDRWVGVMVGAGSVNMQRANDAGLLGEYTFATVVAVADASLAVGDAHRVGQPIEGNMCRGLDWGNANAKPITISFTASASGTFTLVLSLRNSANTRSWLASFTVTTSGQRFAFTVPGDVTGTWLTDNGIGISLAIALGVGTSYNGVAGWNAANCLTMAGASNFMATGGNALYLKDFQVEFGSSMTDFERVPYDIQLLRCQRYFYQKIAGVTPERIATGQCYAANQTANVMRLPVKMRGVPTMVALGLQANGFNSTSAAWSSGSEDAAGFNIQVASGIAAGDGVLVSLETAGTSWIAINAEL